MLYRLVMTGRAKFDMHPGALSGAFGDILCCCMDRSIRQSLTGGLVWDRGYFFGVLEGSETEVSDFCALAEGDGRVDGFSALAFEPAPTRRFETWACGRTDEAPAEAAANDGSVEALSRGGADAVIQHVETVLRTGLVAETPPLALCG